MNNLIILDGVTTTPSILRTANHMDYFFLGEISKITSGKRSQSDQLRIILDEALSRGLQNKYPEIVGMSHTTVDYKVLTEDGYFYYWQRAWSELLRLGFIVNPPIPAECLYDYINPSTKENKKGKVIDISTHQKGYAFDISGEKSINEKLSRVIQAYNSGDCYIKNYTYEKVNNAIHITCIPIV